MSEFKAKQEHINYALLVDPEMTYPVSYYILPNGAKQLCPTVAKGKDLTENQIKELIEKKIVHVGYMPISIYTTTRAELETVKAELGRGKWVSVSEGKPTILEDGESESVLACTRIPLGPKGEYEHHILIAYVKYTNKGWIWREDGKPVANIITHWQPLPTPPHKN